MISWLVDNVNVIYFILGLALLGVGVLFWHNKRGRELLAMAIIIAVGVLVWFLCSLVMTDRKQVENNMRALADAALEVDGNGDKVTPLLAKDFQYQGIPRSEIGEWVAQIVRSQGVTNYYLSSFEIEKISRNKDQGRAEVSFRLRIDGRGGQYPTRCSAVFVVEDGQWRLSSFKEERVF